MVGTPKGIGTMTDPKHLLDEESKEAFVEEQVVMNAPKPRNPLGALATGGKCVRPLLVTLGVSAAISSLAVLVAKVRARRRPRFTGIVLRAKHPRRFGYGRYRFGRFGHAFLTYTYKIPEVRIHAPHLTYKMPSMRGKLPVSSR